MLSSREGKEQMSTHCLLVSPCFHLPAHWPWTNCLLLVWVLLAKFDSHQVRVNLLPGLTLSLTSTESSDLCCPHSHPLLCPCLGLEHSDVLRLPVSLKFPRFTLSLHWSLLSRALLPQMLIWSGMIQDAYLYITKLYKKKWWSTKASRSTLFPLETPNNLSS